MSSIEDLMTAVEANRVQVIDALDAESPAVYAFLMNRFAHSDVSQDPIFQFVFRSFYRLDLGGLTRDFKSEYFATLQRLRGASTVDLAELAARFHAFPTLRGSNALQWSFLSKLAHTIDPSSPIFDAEVATLFAFRRPASGSIAERLDTYTEFHRKLCSTYRTIIENGLVRQTIQLFRTRFPMYASAVGETKTLDFIFWSAGKLLRRKQLPGAPNPR